MNTNRRLLACLAAALASGACSTKPRTFSAMVQPVGTLPPEARNEALSFASCDQMVRKGRNSGFAAAAASGAAAGGTMFAGAAGVAASGTIGIGASATGAVLMAAVPVVGLVAGFGVNRLIRSGHERKYKRTMSACMTEFGYEVTDWTRAPKKQPGTATRQPVAAVPAVQPSPPDAAIGLEPAIG